MSTGREADLVCLCRRVDRATIEAAIRAGADSVEAVHAATGACCCCRSCWPDIEAMLTAVDSADEEE